MDNDSYNIDRYNDEICRIDNVNSSGLETIGHSKGGHKIFRLIPLDRKNIRNDTGESNGIEEFSGFLGNLGKQADEILGSNHIHNCSKDCNGTPDISFFCISLNK